MADLAAITSLETLIATIAGKHESDAVKTDIALAGTALSIMARAFASKIPASVDLSALDAGLAKTFDGLAAVVTAAEGSDTSTITTETATNA